MPPRGTPVIKVKIPGCQPIRRLSGTHDRQMVKRLVRMVHTLHEQGRDDLVNAIARGSLTLLQVYNAFKFSRLEDLPHADELPLFKDLWERRIRDWEGGEDWKEACDGYYRRLYRLMRPDATLADLPKALREMRVQLREHPNAFEKAKMACQGMVRDVLGMRHRIWLELADIPLLKGRVKRPKHPLTADQLRDVVKRLGNPCGPMAWTMATTGMGWREYTGQWEREGDGLRIHGTKTSGRDRLVPLVSLLYPAKCSDTTFERHLKALGLTPYDMRRTYAGLMVEAGIPRPRRKAYMGHAADDILSLYEAQEVREYLVKDAEKMRAILGEPTKGPTLQLLIGGTP